MTSLTIPTHWECACDENWVHPKSEPTCPRCGFNADESPDARPEDIR